MSVADHFAHPAAFPLGWGCIQNLQAPLLANLGVSSYVGNVSLANAMAFAWNLETFTLTTVGSATFTDGFDTFVANGNCTFTLSPAASNRFTDLSLEDTSLWVDADLYPIVTPIGDWPDFLQPRERVCVRDSITLGHPGTLLFMAYDGEVCSGEMGFWIGTDPDNAEKYRIYYLLSLGFRDPDVDIYSINWRDSPGVETPVANGNFTLGGITFPYYCERTDTTTSSTGGTLTATSTSFTY